MLPKFFTTWLLVLFAVCLIAQNPRGVNNIGFGEISVIELAGNGDAWVGSASQGVAFFDHNLQTWQYYSSSNVPQFKSDSVSSIALQVIGGFEHAFIGTTNGVVYNNISTGWDTLQPQGNNNIKGLIYRPDSLMVFSANGVYHYDSSAAHVENFTAPHPITCAIGNNACSNYWAGTVSNGCFATQDGVNYITLDTTIANRKLVDNRVNTCFNDRNCQAVLVGTKGGFSRCPAGLPCQNFTTANGLIENDITAIMEDCTGRIWLGTRDSGMMIFDAGTFTRLTTANGLPDNHIMSVGLITNDCTVWVGSKDGNITVVDSAKQVVNVLTAIRKYDNETAVKVFPQPATNHVQFTFDRQVSAEFRMVDIKGQSVFVQQLNNASFINADVSGFATGMYFYSVTDPDKGVIKTGKVSVIR